MSFEKAFGSTSISCKQLEVRWFFCEKNGRPTKQAIHTMPFQRRNLSYWRGINYGFIKENTTRSKSRKRKHASKSGSEEPDSPRSPVRKRNSPDLLYRLFKHRTVDNNEALLVSPRRKKRLNKRTGQEGKECMEIDDGGGEESKPLANYLSTPNHDWGSGEGRGDVRRGRTEGENGNQENGSIRKKQKLQESADSKMQPEALLTPRGILPLDKDEQKTSKETTEPSLRIQSVSPLSYSADEATNSILEWSHPNAFSSNAVHLGDEDGRPTLPNVIRPKTKAIFHFVYLDSDNHSLKFLSDTSSDQFTGHRRCPFCYFDGGSDAGLLMHCVSCHGTKLNFKAARNEDGTLHVMVTRKAVTSALVAEDHLRDFVYVRKRNQEGLRIPSVPFVHRQVAKAATLDVQTRRKKIRLLQEIGADESVMSKFVPDENTPIRQYFHSRTNEPMLDGEWDVDSDDEPDEAWLDKMSDALLDEFEDVTRPEKCFMKLWNKYMRSHTVVADRLLPNRCMNFLKNHSDILIKNNLRQEWLLHLCNLWDFGLLSQSHVMGCMTEFDALSTRSQGEKEGCRL